MHLMFARQGGFAGISRPPKEIDTDLMSVEESTALRQLVHDADFFTLPSLVVWPDAAVDRFQYSLTIRDGSRENTIQTVEASAFPDALQVSPGLQNLLDRLKEYP